MPNIIGCIREVGGLIINVFLSLSKQEVRVCSFSSAIFRLCD